MFTSVLRLTLAATLCAAAHSHGALLLRYSFDEAASGTTDTLDLGIAPAANGSFVGSATRVANSPGSSTLAGLSVNGANGSSHYVSGGDADKLDGLSNLTITLWFNLQGTPALNDRLASKFFSDGTLATGFDLRVIAPPSGSLTATNFGLSFVQISGQPLSPLPAVNSPVAYSATNTWVFVAVTYDGAAARFYRGFTNGAVTQLGGDVAKHAQFGTPTNTTANFRVGSTAASTSDRTPPAWFDDVRIYDAALSAAELEAIRLESIPSKPVITQQPQSTTVTADDAAAFNVVAAGTGALSYQWYFAGAALPSATNATYSIASASTNHAGNYFVAVTNSYGAVTSSVAVLTVLPAAPPAVISAASSPTRRAVLVSFDRPIADVSTNATNYTMSGGLSVLGATLDATWTNLTIATTPQAANATYTVGLNNVRSRSSSGATLAFAATNVTAQPLYGPLNNVPAAAGWTLLSSLNISNTSAFQGGAPYNIDHRLWVTNFSRIAYYIEIQQANGPLQWVWAAMDAYTTDVTRLGVPTTASGAVFQQPITNLDVLSSVSALVTGTGMSGTVTFGPGTTASPGVTSSGVMTLSNSAGQVVFAFNDWGTGTAASLGIGTAGTNNAAQYTVKRLITYVLPRANPPVDADIVVFGGTSGGVIAAVQAARLGKRAVLVCTDNHLGGLSSGGLGWTDVGPNGNAYIGGMAREFYRRNGAVYGQGVRFNLEAGVTERLFGQLLAEAGVPVVFNEQLASVTMNGRRIAQMIMTNGSVYRGKMFIDATYEGDLIAMAGVNTIVGREASDTFGESLAGVTVIANGGYNYDPYVIPAVATSGLIPFVSPDVPPPFGNADYRVQTYNYRPNFTQAAANFLPITAPTNYDEAQFELVARYLAARLAKDGAVSLSQLMTLDRPPVTGKYDINANGDVSTDFVNASWTWATNTLAGRAAIRQAHEDYMRGFFIFLATSPRSPATIRSAMSSWGMCRDEFLDTGGWPHALYVREARRMVSDYVMIQQNCMGTRVAPDSIGMGAYQMDSHFVHRFASGGLVMREGGTYGPTPAPFPISYRSIIPATGECENVFCTFALSASHVAFSSCRMEPVFMITSQSAATAAAFAIDDHVSVQALDYNKLAVQLQADGQVLTTGATVGDTGVIVDNPEATFVGEWTPSTGVPGYWGADYVTDGNTNKGAKSVTYVPMLPTNDVYEVYMRWTTNANRATNAPVDIIHPAGTNTVILNQQLNQAVWVLLLRTNFNAGTNGRVVLRTDGTSGFVVADAVRFLSATPPLPVLQVVASDATATERGDNARITFVRSGETNSALSISYSLSGTASNGADYVTLPGNVLLPAGVISTNITISAIADSLVEGTESVTLTLLPGTYTIGSLSNATAVIADANSVGPAMLLPMPFDGTQLRFQFDGIAGQSYGVERATNVTGPWAVWTNYVPSTNGAVLIEGSIDGERGFYRLRGE